MIRVLLSGGMDSAVCLAWTLLRHTRAVDCLFVSYGQRHREQEYAAARRVSQHFGTHLISVPLGLIGGSSLTGGSGALSGSDVVVPDRNATMLRQAAATFPLPEAVVIGSCADDHEVFEDCRPEFFEKMCVELSPVHVETPLLRLDKVGVYDLAKTYGGTALLDLTWSCYAGGDTPCGECGACEARRKGFEG